MTDVGGTDRHVARLNAMAIVAGAMIAAAVGIFGTWYLDHQDDRRLGHREDQAVRGTARVLYAEFLQAAAQMDVLGHDRLLRPFDPSFNVQVRPGDLRLLAAQLTGPQWGRVATALTNIEGLDTFVNTLIERGRRRLTSKEMCLVRFDSGSVVYAALAVADLADAPNRPPEPEPLTCSPAPAQTPGTP